MIDDKYNKSVNCKKYESDDFCFDNFKSHPQILILGREENDTKEILKLIMTKLKMLVNTSNTTIYTKKDKKIKYELFAKIICYSNFDESTIESILAFQMDTPDEQYSNRWQNFDTCINIFDRCFDELEFEISHKKQFEKLYKYSNSYKIINIILSNYMYNGFNSDNFDYIFCTKDSYKSNINQNCKDLNDCSFHKCITENNALVIEKNIKKFFTLKYIFLEKEKENKLICLNDEFSTKEKIEFIEI